MFEISCWKWTDISQNLLKLMLECTLFILQVLNIWLVKSILTVLSTGHCISRSNPTITCLFSHCLRNAVGTAGATADRSYKLFAWLHSYFTICLEWPSSSKARLNFTYIVFGHNRMTNITKRFISIHVRENYQGQANIQLLN